MIGDSSFVREQSAYPGSGSGSLCDCGIDPDLFKTYPGGFR
jgi:hypothetical protein